MCCLPASSQSVPRWSHAAGDQHSNQSPWHCITRVLKIQVLFCLVDVESAVTVTSKQLSGYRILSKLHAATWHILPQGQRWTTVKKRTKSSCVSWLHQQPHYNWFIVCVQVGASLSGSCGSVSSSNGLGILPPSLLQRAVHTGLTLASHFPLRNVPWPFESDMEAYS